MLNDCANFAHMTVIGILPIYHLSYSGKARPYVQSIVTLGKGD
ncbi:hypothetical protein [Glaciimonas sp. PCH181]|nr:hypothetical protein [Glaciimonas sp. PCH181]